MVITVLAVVAGVVLLTWALDESEYTAVAAEDAGDETGADSETDGDEPADGDADADADETPVATSSTVPPPPPLVTHRPGEVKIATVNGTGRSGLAGATADILSAQGYVTLAKNAANPPVAQSNIYYLATYQDDAKAVASAVNAPAEIINPAPANMLTLVSTPENVADFHIFVVLGTDDVIPVTVS